MIRPNSFTNPGAGDLQTQAVGEGPLHRCRNLGQLIGLRSRAHPCLHMSAGKPLKDGRGIQHGAERVVRWGRRVLLAARSHGRLLTVLGAMVATASPSEGERDLDPVPDLQRGSLREAGQLLGAVQ